MALAKTGYSSAIQGTTKVKAAVDSDGYLAPEGTTAAGTKTITITKANADNSLQDNTEVLNFFLELAKGRSDSLTNTMAVTWTTDTESANTEE